MALTRIAKVRLAPGQAGYYDEVSGIYLTIVDHTAEVYSHMNTTNLKRAVKNGKIYVASGSLEPVVQDSMEIKMQEIKKEVKEVERKEAKAKQEEVKPVVLEVEEGVEAAAIAEKQEDEKSDVKKSKKKTSAKKEDK